MSPVRDVHIDDTGLDVCRLMGPPRVPRHGIDGCLRVVTSGSKPTGWSIPITT